MPDLITSPVTNTWPSSTLSVASDIGDIEIGWGSVMGRKGLPQPSAANATTNRMCESLGFTVGIVTRSGTCAGCPCPR